MPVTALTGQDLVDMANNSLMGYAGIVDPDVLLQFVNKGKDEVWALLKSLNTDYFMQQTQFTDNTQINYFGPLVSGTRQYTLPADLREIWFVEVVSQGFEQTVFTYKDINDNDWRTARRASNVDSTLTPTIEYFYTIIGKDQLALAQFPEFPFQLVIWYVRNILDFESNDLVDQILLPYAKPIAEYAAKRVVLGAQDESLLAGWIAEWKESLMMIAQGSPRNMADPVFVSDFLG